MTYLPSTPSEAKAQHAARAIIKDAKRGPAMGTAVEQHCIGLGRAQLAEVVALLFAELAAHHNMPKAQ
jgi:uncharacterized membrane protein